MLQLQAGANIGANTTGKVSLNSTKTKYQCALCSGMYTNKTGALRHVRAVHLGHKAYRCNLCAREFEYCKAVLEHHEATHAGSLLAYTCLMSTLQAECLSHLKKATTLSDPAKVETKTTFSCHLCSFITKRTLYMRLHMRHHLCKELNYLPFECGTCGVLFMTRLALCRHAAVVHKSQSDVVMRTDTNKERQIDDELRAMCRGLPVMHSLGNSTETANPHPEAGEAVQLAPSIGSSGNLLVAKMSLSSAEKHTRQKQRLQLSPGSSASNSPPENLEDSSPRQSTSSASTSDMCDYE